MRMIDADALLEQMQPVSTFKINSYADAAAMTIANAYIKLVENQPTVEAPDINVGNMDTTTHDSISAKTGKNDGDKTSGDCISRQAALETIRTMQTYKLFEGDDMILIDKAQVQTELMMLPSAQPAQSEMIKEIRRWINSGNRGNADYFIVDRIEEIINEYEIN